MIYFFNVKFKLDIVIKFKGWYTFHVEVFMIKVYEDKSIYIGEMVSNQRCGEGTIYFLEDIFCGCKVMKKLLIISAKKLRNSKLCLNLHP